MSLSLEKLKYWLTYHPETGVLTWNHAPAYTVEKGAIAGFIDGNGYRLIELMRTTYRVNRLIWFYMTGEWPKGVVDHKNRIKTDDRWDNLRDVPQGINCQNRSLSKTNKSGKNGVYWQKAAQKWHAQITLANKKKHLGLFDKLEDAINAREIAEALYFNQP